MPISRFMVRGWDAPPTRFQHRRYPDGDLSVFRNLVMKDRLRRRFDRCCTPIDMFVDLDPPKTIVIADPRQHITAKFGADLINPLHITMLYTNNAGSAFNHVSFTPWIMAHRFGHAIQLYDFGKLMIAEPVIWRHLIDLYTRISCRHDAVFHGHVLCMATPTELLVQLATAILTMRSARDGRLAMDFDVGCEVIAQYMICGHVRLADANLVVRAPSIAPWRTHVELTHLQRDLNLAEQAINDACAHQFEALRGHIIAF